MMVMQKLVTILVKSLDISCESFESCECTA